MIEHRSADNGRHAPIHGGPARSRLQKKWKKYTRDNSWALGHGKFPNDRFSKKSCVLRSFPFTPFLACNQYSH